MAVDKPGQERLSLQINPLSAPFGRSRDVGRVADGGDLVSTDHNGFGVRMFWIAGEDLAVKENALDCFVSACPGDSGKKDRDYQDYWNWISQSHLRSFLPLFTHRNTEAMVLILQRMARRKAKASGFLLWGGTKATIVYNPARHSVA